MKIILWILRIIVGCLFIFSGVVKANDPLGLSYKMNEFFEVWHMPWAEKYSLALSVLMIGFEIIAGVALLIGAAFRVFSFLLLLLTAFFTFLTAYVLFSGKIKECGCFGDCIKITNEETFWKDVILLVFVIVLFLFRNKIKPLFSGYPTTALVILSAFFAFSMQWWALEHLPFHDCLPYKIGVNIKEKTMPPPGSTPDVYSDIFIYEKDGVKKEFTTENYPWEDTTWKYVDRITKLVKKGNAEPEIKDFVISDLSGNEHTDEILGEPYVFLLFLKDADKARNDNVTSLQSLIKKCNQLNIPFYVLTSGNVEASKGWLQRYGLIPNDLLVFDLVASKSAVRSNPGLILLQQGVIRGKWSFRDYPKDAAIESGKLKLVKYGSVSF
ncbi:MAG TPA: BT_3928 family protein [Flavipsychrobacter sp.]|nr:BT_3928 family protein [Flavipsychrobacter sp.]